jgi:hypothetical protein
MIPRATMSLTAAAHAQLFTHLFPGDGKEAAAVLVCTRVPGARLRVLVREVILVPNDACAERTESSLTWPGAYIEQAIDVAGPGRHGIVLLHSHPSGFPAFSHTDDKSDREVIPCIFDAFDGLHGTAVMLPTGCIFGRLYDKQGVETPIDLVSVAGDDLMYWWRDDLASANDRPTAFTSDMRCELSRLTALVIGTSGTGSPTAEAVSRLGFGRVLGIDHDHVEEKNLDRILNTTLADAQAKRLKVHVLADRINLLRASPFFEGIDANVMTRRAVLVAAEADVIFCCVDSQRGRMIADRLAAAFLLPLFDVGVAIPTRSTANGLAIAEVTGRIDYVYPGGSSLSDRGVYTPASLHAEYLAEADPAAHAEHVKVGYIEDHPEQAPAVIALNMRAASDCVMEFIARAYPFRHKSNDHYARKRFMLAEVHEEHSAESAFQAKASPLLASGAAEPLLGLPVLGL